MHQQIIPTLLTAAVTAALMGAPALAQNKKPEGGSTAGVIVIDQARAEAGGITPGDAPGFPVTLSLPGSYRLMSNLTVTDPNVTAIDVAVNDVTVDLNGFVIQGPVNCTGGSAATITCTPMSAGVGVQAGGRHFVAVRNGTIRGFYYGVSAGYFGQVEGLRVGHTVASGLLSSNATQISGNVVYLAGGSGISGYGDIRNNSVYMAKVHGINVGSGSLVVGNRVTMAGQYGIDAYGFGDAALASNVVTQGTLGAINGGIRLGGNACNGQLCQ